jgi:hypothetical protein
MISAVVSGDSDGSYHSVNIAELVLTNNWSPYYKMHAPEMHPSEMHAHEVYIYEFHTDEMHVYETHSVRCTPTI